MPIYCLNVTYPLIDDEVAAFAAGKKAMLMVEEGQPEFIEQALNTILRRRDIQTKISGKDVLPMAGEYTPQVVTKGIKSFLELHALIFSATRRRLRTPPPCSPIRRSRRWPRRCRRGRPASASAVPERPIFAAMKLVQQELGQHHVAADIGCHLFAILPPFNIGAHHDGLRPRPGLGVGLQRQGRQEADLDHGRRRLLAQRAVHQRSPTPSTTSTTASSWWSTIFIRRRPAARTSCPRARSIRRARPTTPSSMR